MSSQISNLLAEIREASLSLTDEFQSKRALLKLQQLVGDQVEPLLRQADRDILKLKADNARMMAACKAAYESIARFPGSVHDRAMGKLDRVVHPSRPRVYPDCEVEADRRRQEAHRLRTGLSSLGITITPEIEALIAEGPAFGP
ncbi:hypothetical protein [Bosea sp. RAC05]|uniref:hypothetical protein n=1 Tax=Bosea sp. RAC05 TaxID=1842539 RepID=UPI00083E1440|nr:hypothetical protein [Bosea sp. RAC05]AOG03148.1 hypothetical protein BSY19_5417 [Bosea sp. RAC05]